MPEYQDKNDKSRDQGGAGGNGAADVSADDRTKTPGAGLAGSMPYGPQPLAPGVAPDGPVSADQDQGGAAGAPATVDVATLTALISALPAAQLSILIPMVMGGAVGGHPAIVQLVKRALPAGGAPPEKQEPKATEQAALAMDVIPTGVAALTGFVPGAGLVALAAGAAAKKVLLDQKRVAAIFQEAERLYSMGWDHRQRGKFAAGSSYYYNEAPTDGGGSFEWCGAFAARCYMAAGLSHQVVQGMASTYKIAQLAQYSDPFSIDNLFFTSPEEVQGNPAAGLPLAEFHAKYGGQRKGLEVLLGGGKSVLKGDNITHLNTTPETLQADLKGADIVAGDIMIVGKGVHGAHVTIVRDLNFDEGTIGTYEGNASTPTDSGGTYKQMSGKSVKDLQTLRTTYKLDTYQIDSEYLANQKEVLAEVVPLLEQLKGDKGWKGKIQQVLNANPKADKNWALQMGAQGKYEAKLKFLKRRQEKLGNPELLKSVVDWETAAQAGAVEGQAIGGRTHVAKFERDIYGGKETKGSRTYTDEAGKPKKGPTLKRPMRFFYRLAERDFGPQYYASKTSVAKAIAQKKTEGKPPPK